MAAKNSSDSPYTKLIDKSEADVEMSKGTRRVLYALKFFIGILLFVFVLACSIFSKLTLISITDQLRNITWNITVSGTPALDEIANRSHAARLYWQLFLIVVLPNVFAFVRSFVFGVFGKTKKSFPWPVPSSILLVSPMIDVSICCIYLDHGALIILCRSYTVYIPLYQLS